MTALPALCRRLTGWPQNPVLMHQLVSMHTTGPRRIDRELVFAVLRAAATLAVVYFGSG